MEQSSEFPGAKGEQSLRVYHLIIDFLDLDDQTPFVWRQQGERKRGTVLCLMDLAYVLFPDN